MVNRQNGVLTTFFVSLFLFMAVGVFAQDQYLSPSAMVADAAASKIYITETTANQISVFDVASETVEKRIALSAAPTGIAISSDKSKLYVTAGKDFGSVLIIDIAKGKVIDKIAVGYAPVSPVLSPDGSRLYVCNQFNDNIGVIDLNSKKQITTIDVDRQPVAAAITPDGSKLFVANLLPSGATNGDYNASVISIIDAINYKPIAEVLLPNGAIDVRGVCVSPDGKYVYISGILARYQLPTTQLERGWMNTNAMSIIDAKSNKLVNTILLDDVDLGAANPWAVACSSDPDGSGKSLLLVSHAGTHEVSVIDRDAMHKKLDDIAAGKEVSHVSKTSEDVPNDLSFLTGIRKRVKLAGNGPRALAVVGNKVYAAEYFSGSVGVISLWPRDVRVDVKSVSLGKEPEMSAARKGEMYFNDASFCFQKWQSCTTCHPDEARTDAINWDLLNDEIGNPKQTKSLLLSHKTAPVMITGIRADAETAVRAGIRFIQFAVRPEEDAVAIDEYLKSLEPAPSPYLVEDSKGKRVMSESAKKGKEIFANAGCGDCHSGPLYTDLNTHDLGTGMGVDEGVAFDTPTLIEIWRSSPYLYDGRAETIKEVLTKYNTDNQHGDVSGLTEKQIDDLAEFVLSLSL